MKKIHIIHDLVVLQMIVSFPFEKKKEIIERNQSLKQWQIICEQQRHNWKNYIFIACALPSPPQPEWRETL